MDDADRIVLSYRVEDDTRDEWVRAALGEDAYRSYLRRVHGGPASVGDEWAEFVSRGCGSPVDVTLRVDAIEDGTDLGPDTDLAFEPA